MNTKLTLIAAVLAFAGATSAQAQNPLTSRTDADDLQVSQSTATRASVIADMNRYAAVHGTLERNAIDEIQVASSNASRNSVVGDTRSYAASGHSLERNSADELQKSYSTSSRSSVTAQANR